MKPSIDRRSRKDRRQSKHSPAFPFRDDNDVLVSCERREIPDRRAEGLKLTDSEITQEEFEEYIKLFQENSNV